MRLRLLLLMSLFAGVGVIVFVLGGAPSTADGSTTEGGAAKMAGRGGAGGAGAIGSATEAGESSSSSSTTTLGRRLTGFTEGLVEALGKGPPTPTPEQARLAGGLIALFNDYSPEAAAEIYENPTAGQEEWVQWLRERVGKCGAGEPMTVNGDRARYLYPCERGQLEIGFQTDPDTGKLPGLVMGARGVDLADPVREAAEAALRLYHQWDPALFRSLFSDKFKEEEFRRFLLDVRLDSGDCSLGEPDLVSVRGTLIHLDCERARRLMKVELMQEEDRIKIFWIRNPRR